MYASSYASSVPQLLEPPQLIERSIDLINRYNPAVDTVDVHLAREGLRAGASTTPSLLLEDREFLAQVLYGTERQAKALRVFLNALFHVKAAAVNRADFLLLKVMAYLLFFRLKELTPRKLILLLDGQDAAKMHHLLGFALDKAGMEAWVLDGWCALLDRGFLEREILTALDDARPVLTEWMERTSARAFGIAGSGGGVGVAEGGASKRSVQVRAATVPVAPKLTQPRARLPSEPMRIATTIPARPAPSFASRTLEDVEAEAAGRRRAVGEATAAKYASASAPALNETKRNVHRIREEVEAARAAEMVPLPGSRPPPGPPTSGADVPYTIAAVLREDAGVRAKAASEAKMLREYEATLHDSTNYYAWQERERAKDEEARLVAVAARKEDADSAAVAVQRAAELRLAGNHRVAVAVKASSAAAAEHLTLEREGVVVMKAQLAAQTREIEYIRPTRAKAAVIVAKRAVVEGVREAAVAAEAARAAERAEQAVSRAEVIRQIRGLEAVPRPHVKLFDRTTGGGNVLSLESMSLVELHERLELTRHLEAEALAARREDILADKGEARAMLAAKVAALQERRTQAQERAREARAAKVGDAAAATAAASSARDFAIVELADKLAARKAARAAEAAALKAVQDAAAKEAAFRGSSVVAMEEERHAQVLVAAARTARAAQGQALAFAAAGDKATARRKADATLKAARESAAGAVADKVKALALLDAEREAQAFRLASTTAKKNAFFAQTVEERALVDARDATNPFAARVRAAEQDGARSLRGGVPRPVEALNTLTRRVDRLPPGHPLAPNFSLKQAQALEASRKLDAAETALLP